MIDRPTLYPRSLGPLVLAGVLAFAASMSQAKAESMILIEADTGKVLHAEHATHPWYPASITKVMTAYLVLQAVKANRLNLDSLLTVSERASAESPSKMGFKPGTQITVDNALKMMMVKSANDIAVVLAEGVGGSVEGFATEMNATSRRLGMTQSSWVNPNGLPDERQISSARDLAILARALLRDFPEHDAYWNIAAIKFGKRMMRNTNSMIGRYPGADGMKTGFVCSSGFNLVASASRGGRRLIAVVLGSPSSPVRAAKTAGLLERGFNSRAGLAGGLTWLASSGTGSTVDSLAAMDATPPDMREQMCGKHRKRPAAESADDEPTTSADSGEPGSAQGFMLSSLSPGTVKNSSLLGPVVAIANPVVVHIGAKPPSGAAADTVVAATVPAAKPARSKPAKPLLATPAAVAAGIGEPSAPVAAVVAPHDDSAAGQISAAHRAFAPTGGLNSLFSSFAPSRANAAPAAEAPAAPAVAAAPAPRPRPKPQAKRQPNPQAGAMSIGAPKPIMVETASQSFVAGGAKPAPTAKPKAAAGAPKPASATAKPTVAAAKPVTTAAKPAAAPAVR